MIRTLHGQYRFHRELSRLSRWWSLAQALSDILYCYAYGDYDEGPTRGVPACVPTDAG